LHFLKLSLKELSIALHDLLVFISSIVLRVILTQIDFFLNFYEIAGNKRLYEALYLKLAFFNFFLVKLP